MVRISYKNPFAGNARIFLLLMAAILVAAQWARFIGKAPEWVLGFSFLHCPLSFFGVSCPTCGLGRSIAHALAGSFERSLHFHPLGIPVLAIALFFVVGFRVKFQTLARRWVWAMAGLLVLFQFWRTVS